MPGQRRLSPRSLLLLLLLLLSVLVLATLPVQSASSVAKTVSQQQQPCGRLRIEELSPEHVSYWLEEHLGDYARSLLGVWREHQIDGEFLLHFPWSQAVWIQLVPAHIPARHLTESRLRGDIQQLITRGTLDIPCEAEVEHIPRAPVQGSVGSLDSIAGALEDLGSDIFPSPSAVAVNADDNQVHAISGGDKGQGNTPQTTLSLRAADNPDTDEGDEGEEQIPDHFSEVPRANYHADESAQEAQLDEPSLSRIKIQSVYNDQPEVKQQPGLRTVESSIDSGAPPSDLLTSKATEVETHQEVLWQQETGNPHSDQDLLSDTLEPDRVQEPEIEDLVPAEPQDAAESQAEVQQPETSAGSVLEEAGPEAGASEKIHSPQGERVNDHEEDVRTLPEDGSLPWPGQIEAPDPDTVVELKAGFGDHALPEKPSHEKALQSEGSQQEPANVQTEPIHDDAQTSSLQELTDEVLASEESLRGPAAKECEAEEAAAPELDTASHESSDQMTEHPADTPEQVPGWSEEASPESGVQVEDVRHPTTKQSFGHQVETHPREAGLDKTTLEEHPWEQPQSSDSGLSDPADKAGMSDSELEDDGQSGFEQKRDSLDLSQLLSRISDPEVAEFLHQIADTRPAGLPHLPGWSAGLSRWKRAGEIVRQLLDLEQANR